MPPVGAGKAPSIGSMGGETARPWRRREGEESGMTGTREQGEPTSARESAPEAA
ncbi:hypothetical protein IMZ11_07115 [Microtetraspora sp. AC03309]|uniref:hypothetical protein n=1 Tax=Microtetraspora sp. AC03309 TaxID=2779376 RepID=UPI001E569D71|nr:hypothetical protein [Microtetraspora sp. AC03309]MCC5575412.1 hypothetical protein [Microtetraspora sp. AC03309]